MLDWLTLLPVVVLYSFEPFPGGEHVECREPFVQFCLFTVVWVRVGSNAKCRNFPCRNCFLLLCTQSSIQKIEAKMRNPFKKLIKQTSLRRSSKRQKKHHTTTEVSQFEHHVQSSSVTSENENLERESSILDYPELSVDRPSATLPTVHPADRQYRIKITVMDLSSKNVQSRKRSIPEEAEHDYDRDIWQFRRELHDERDTPGTTHQDNMPCIPEHLPGRTKVSRKPSQAKTNVSPDCASVREYVRKTRDVNFYHHFTKDHSSVTTEKIVDMDHEGFVASLFNMVDTCDGRQYDYESDSGSDTTPFIPVPLPSAASRPTDRFEELAQPGAKRGVPGVEGISLKQRSDMSGNALQNKSVLCSKSYSLDGGNSIEYTAIPENFPGLLQATSQHVDVGAQREDSFVFGAEYEERPKTLSRPGHQPSPHGDTSHRIHVANQGAAKLRRSKTRYRSHSTIERKVMTPSIMDSRSREDAELVAIYNSTPGSPGGTSVPFSPRVLIPESLPQSKRQHDCVAQSSDDGTSNDSSRDSSIGGGYYDTADDGSDKAMDFLLDGFKDLVFWSKSPS